MDLLKTPSIPSLLDSDIESVGSFRYDDFEELDEVEYALPVSEAPTLEEVLTSDLDEHIELEVAEEVVEKDTAEPTCSSLQVELLHAVSQQVLQAEERSSAGSATALSVGINGRLTVGTAHGHLLSFHDQTLRWVCNGHGECGAVTCLAYNKDSTRLLVGYGRGDVYQYESIRGAVLRKITLGGDTWGTLRVTWAGTAGLALDTGGSVWLIRFIRPLGVRTVKISCLFSGARGEVIAMSARCPKFLALVTLTRLIVVAGGQAAGLRLGGHPDTMPVIEWYDPNSRLLVCARGHALQWLNVTYINNKLGVKPLKRIDLQSVPLWLGWLGGSITIFDTDENLRILNDDVSKPLDLSSIEPVYASAFFKGYWTDGRVSQAMCKAGETALAGICISEGTLSILGRKGITRISLRDTLTRARAFISSGQYYQALKLLSSSQGPKAKELASEFVVTLSDRPHILSNKNVAVQIVKVCLKLGLTDELWNCLWEKSSREKAFVEALGDAAVRGDMSENPPTPDFTQALIEALADFEPELVERVVASLPLTAIDPHRASLFTRERKLWRGVGAIAAAIDGCSGAMRELVQYVDLECAVRTGGECSCAGGALVLAAADALAARSPAARPLPPHAKPSARHDALHSLLHDEEGRPCPLRVMVTHETSAAVRLLEQCTRDPPFAGPLGKQNRLRVARALLSYTDGIQEADRRLEILEFITTQLGNGSLPLDQELIQKVQDVVETTPGERSDRAWLAVLLRIRMQRDQLLPLYRDHISTPRVLWRVDALLDNHDLALKEFFEIDNPSEQDINELFEFLHSNRGLDFGANSELHEYLPALINLRPEATASLLNDEQALDTLPATLQRLKAEPALEFGKCLLNKSRLRGDAATIYLQSLCELRPAEVKSFLVDHPGIVRPEDALTIVKKSGPKNAEPICLEATGDHMGALEASLRLIKAAPENSQGTLASEASELCARVAPTVPRSVAAEMWTRLLRSIEAIPPQMLFEAIAYLPLEELLLKTCNSAQVQRVLADGASGEAMWRCAKRIAGRETHEALRRALFVARRGIAVRGRCVRCGTALDLRVGVRTAHCARAYHADCEAYPFCECGTRLPTEVIHLPPLHPHRISVSQDFNLLVVAPPRPDLEGIV
ncbi:unnamed protein product [Leptosia nina]|uniref:Vacuolar protein sorting-associated protein 8 homolog n=1 Tax=Leptosia nina TaxID=320188 RepID=A0AAV1K559_9NEOP